MDNTNKSKIKNVLAIVWKIVFTAAAAAVLFFLFAILNLILAAAGVHLVLAYIVGTLPLVMLLPLIWLKKRKKYMKIYLLVLALCVVVTGINIGIVKYDESIKVRTSSEEYSYEVTAQDAFVFIVHKDNPVDGLTTEQLQGIFSGTITNWSEVGGENKTIKAYQCEPDSVNQRMMSLFMGDTPLMEAATEMGYGYLYAWEELVSEYRNKPASIGFCFTSYISGNEDVKVLSVDGVAPTQENIQNGSYPIATPAGMIADGE